MSSFCTDYQLFYKLNVIELPEDPEHFLSMENFGRNKISNLTMKLSYLQNDKFRSNQRIILLVMSKFKNRSIWCITMPRAMFVELTSFVYAKTNFDRDKEKKVKMKTRKLYTKRKSHLLCKTVTYLCSPFRDSESIVYFKKTPRKADLSSLLRLLF